jgi:hypothetical protein
VIDHHIRWIATRLQEFDYPLQHLPCFFSIDRGQNDETWVQLRCGKEFPKVSCVTCDDDPVFGDATLDYAVIALAAPSNIQRMNGFVFTGFIQPARQRW